MQEVELARHAPKAAAAAPSVLTAVYSRCPTASYLAGPQPRDQPADGRSSRLTTSARRLAASCAGPRVVLIFCLCCASCSSSLRIFSSRLAVG